MCIFWDQRLNLATTFEWEKRSACRSQGNIQKYFYEVPNNKTNLAYFIEKLYELLRYLFVDEVLVVTPRVPRVEGVVSREEQPF